MRGVRVFLEGEREEGRARYVEGGGIKWTRLFDTHDGCLFYFTCWAGAEPSERARWFALSWITHLREPFSQKSKEGLLTTPTTCVPPNSELQLSLDRKTHRYALFHR